MAVHPLDSYFSSSADGETPFYAVEDVPANSVLLVRSREDALDFPTGKIELALCPETGFITNQAFDEDLVNYNAEYEETQGFSGTFSAFHRRLAEDLIDRYDLRGKTILEIGCGKGEFLTLLCELGGNEGVGFDPAYRPERNTSSVAEQITFIRDFYSEAYADYTADFVCCKMTLEHIPDVADFVGMVRRAVGDSPDTVVFFQVPEVRRVLSDVAFWDVYHEHCSYFSAGSLGRLFRSQGFEVLSLWTDYDDQYLMIEARPALNGVASGAPLASEESPEELAADVDRFADKVRQRLDAWRTVLTKCHHEGQHVALWGGGSKAVAFLTTLGLSDEIGAVVDINPFKHGTFLPGTAHEVVAPEALTSDPPDVVIIMNPIYHDEIKAELQSLGLAPTLWHIEADPVHLRTQEAGVR